MCMYVCPLVGVRSELKGIVDIDSSLGRSGIEIIEGAIIEF